MSEAARLLQIGRVARSHGLCGDTVCELFTDRLERLDEGSVLSTESKELRVLRSSPLKRRFIVHFEGIEDRESADALRGEILYAPPIFDPDALWVHELIGSKVETVDGLELGHVVSVETNPSSDLLILDCGALIPCCFITENDPGIKITVDIPKGLIEETA